MEFDFFVSQRLYFGPGKLSWLPDLAESYGRTLLLITGGIGTCFLPKKVSKIP